MNAAVTGGTGFVGAALLRRLVPMGGSVRALVRSDAAAEAVAANGATPVRGDLTVDGGCDGLVQRRDVVFHGAAWVGSAGRWRDHQRLTIDGTRRLLDAALAVGPARFVYISSAGVYAAEPPGTIYSADRTPARPARYNLYGRAKLQAEELVRSKCEQAGCPWTVLRLCTVIGPEARFFLRVLVGWSAVGGFPMFGDGGNRFALVHIDDTVDAIVRAATASRANGRILDIAGDENVTVGAMLDRAAVLLGRPMRGRRMSPRAGRIIARIAETVMPLMGMKRPLARGFVDLMTTDQHIDTSAARRALGWRAQIGFEEGLQQTVAWGRSAGLAGMGFGPKELQMLERAGVQSIGGPPAEA